MAAPSLFEKHKTLTGDLAGMNILWKLFQIVEEQKFNCSTQSIFGEIRVHKI